MANTTKTTNTKKTTNTPKEVKSMKKVETKKAVVKEVKNEVKKNTFLTIQEIVKLYEEAGIKCYNPECKGNYRIMGTKKGSSLNLRPTKGYFIFTSDEDLELIQSAELKFDDLKVEPGTNSQDKSRKHTVSCTDTETLKALLKVYASNPLNKVA